MPILTEIEVEGLGIMRQLNDWQQLRARRIAKRENRALAFVAFGLRMEVRQFKKLSPELQKAAWETWGKLTSPGAFRPDSPVPKRTVPRPWERISIEDQITLGLQLLAVKKDLPHGHFGPWVEDRSGLTKGQAERYMRMAREAGAA